MSFATSRGLMTIGASRPLGAASVIAKRGQPIGCGFDADAPRIGGCVNGRGSGTVSTMNDASPHDER
jgi:hypothetical protein